MKKRIVLIDQDSDSLQSNALIINGTGRYDVLDQFDSVDEAIIAFRKTIPDIILMDIQTSGGIDAIEGIRIIKRKYPPIAVIVHTKIQSQEYVFNCLRAGVVGYIIKDFNLPFLIKALNEVELGGAPLSHEISRMVIHSFFENPNSPLTQRERQILVNLSEGKTFSEVANVLNISPSTSRSHIRNIYSKLKVHSKSDALALARRESYF